MQPKQPRILLVAHADIRDIGRIVDEGVSLVRHGFQVQVIGSALRSGLKVHDEFKGMGIYSVPVVNQYHPLIILRAVWAWLTKDAQDKLSQEIPFRKSNILTVIFYNLWVLRIALGLEFDLIHCHQHQPLPAVVLLSRIRRVPLVYDVHESTPDNRAGMGIRGWFAIRIEQFFLARPDVVITVGERLARALRERGARQTVVMGNWKPLERYDIPPDVLQAHRSRLNLDRYKLVVSFLGTFHPGRDIEPLLEAVAQSPDVFLMIGGRGYAEGLVAEKARQFPNIHWLGWIKLDDVPLYTLLGDVVYCPINPEIFMQSHFVVPTKCFEAFAAGKAIIARQGVGEIGEILQDYQAAVLLESVTPDTLKEAFSQLSHPEMLAKLQQESQRARSVYNWETAENRLLQVYHNLLTGYHEF